MRALTIADAATIILGLQDEIRRSEESRYDHRLHGVLLVAQGMTCPQVAALLEDAPRSVEYWVRGFVQSGWPACGKESDPAARGASTRSNCGKSTPLCAGCRVRWGWAGTCGMARPWRPGSPSAMGWSWGCGSASVCSGSWAFGCVSRVLAWCRPMRHGRRRTKKLQALMADPTVDLWASDEVHFQQYGSRCRMWIPPETKDPVLLHASTRRGVGYFGAVRLRDGRFYYCREADKFKGLTFFDQLIANSRFPAARTSLPSWGSRATTPQRH